MRVRVPASSANLGPAFDSLGMALDVYAELGVIADPDDEAELATIPEGGRIADEYHPATKAFLAGGGSGHVWVRSRIPAGRGMGFSGAVRVGGLVAAAAQRRGVGGWTAETEQILGLATELEGHADNVAASLFGGVVATAAGRAVNVPLGLDPAVVLWIPSSLNTSTDESRSALPAEVAFADAVFNVGRTALLIAALAAGDASALRDATADRLHQDRRLARAEPSRDALAAGLAAGAWCGWLSGSGPTVALLCAAENAEAVRAALPDGAGRQVRIDHAGTVIEHI